MTSTPDPVDERLLAAHDLALAALREITPESSIGEPVEYHREDDGVVSLRFANRLPGYPGWFWTVSLARLDDAEPTVLEVELLPGDGALLAPEWTPWAVRLAEYHAAQAALAEAAEAAGEGEIDDEDDELDDDEGDDFDDDADLDDDDLDDEGARVLHAGDVDGVDIDELDSSEDELDSDDDELGSDEDDDDLVDELDSDEDDDDLDEDDGFDDEDGDELDVHDEGPYSRD